MNTTIQLHRPHNSLEFSPRNFSLLSSITIRRTKDLLLIYNSFNTSIITFQKFLTYHTHPPRFSRSFKILKIPKIPKIPYEHPLQTVTMSFAIRPIMSKSLVWQIPLVSFIIRLIWLFKIHPFVRWLGSWIAWMVMWELSALELINKTTAQCERKNGGTMEKKPARLAYKDWIIHHGCVGREEGYDHPIYGVSQGSKARWRTY